MLTILDRPHLTNISTLERTFVELSKYMSEFEVDLLVTFMNSISNSKLESNWTIDDTMSQLRIMFGEERVHQLKALWSKDNQHLIKNGKKKYLHKDSGKLFDGLDAYDNPNDYEELLM